MVTFKIMNEGELFCTSLNFNLDNDSHEKLIGDPGTKDEDAVKQLNNKLDVLIKEYKLKFRQVQEMRKYNLQSFARAVYFSTYYNRRNKEYNDYVGEYFYKGKRDIENFDRIWS